MWSGDPPSQGRCLNSVEHLNENPPSQGRCFCWTPPKSGQMFLLDTPQVRAGVSVGHPPSQGRCFCWTPPKSGQVFLLDTPQVRAGVSVGHPPSQGRCFCWTPPKSGQVFLLDTPQVRAGVSVGHLNENPTSQGRCPTETPALTCGVSGDMQTEVYYSGTSLAI